MLLLNKILKISCKSFSQSMCYDDHYWNPINEGYWTSFYSKCTCDVSCTKHISIIITQYLHEANCGKTSCVFFCDFKTNLCFGQSKQLYASKYNSIFVKHDFAHNNIDFVFVSFATKRDMKNL
jgi:hypothetical protein